MKVYNREDFLKLPAGILYMQGDEYMFAEIAVKGDTLFNNDVAVDWTSMDFGTNFDVLEHHFSTPLKNLYDRDGRFDHGAIFAVFERNDLEIIKDVVDNLLNNSIYDGIV